MAGLKRRHEDSSFAAPQSKPRNIPSLSINPYNEEDDRVHSPNTIMDVSCNVFNPPCRESKRALSFTSKRESHDAGNDPDAEKRVTIWNWREQRKLSGNSAPFKKNLRDYIRKHQDWEEYVGQDKDELTGKKLPPKKMKPATPQDPDHPWYTQKSGGMPTSPCAAPAPSTVSHTSSYGTRSSRLQESDDIRPTRERRQMARPAPPPETVSEGVLDAILLNPELSVPMQVNLEPPAVVAQRRAIEMAARRQALASGVPECEEHDSKSAADLETEKAAEAAAWQIASEKIAQLRADKEAAARKLADESLSDRRNNHAEVQHTVVSSAMARIEAFRNKRRMIAA